MQTIRGGEHSVAVLCPINKQRGKPVDSVTLKSLLCVSLDRLHDTEYFFCPADDCPVVYFAADGQCFTEDEVRVPVYQKHPTANDVLVCYCFLYNYGEIKVGGEAKQHIIAAINAGIAARQCACDIRNPQGSCCLGNVRKIVSSKPDLSQ